MTPTVFEQAAFQTSAEHLLVPQNYLGVFLFALGLFLEAGDAKSEILHISGPLILVKEWLLNSLFTPRK